MTEEIECSYKDDEYKCRGKVGKWHLCEGHLEDYSIDTEPHHCHFCGEYVINGYTYKGERHYLSDCRPDLVKHEIGKDCTWSYQIGEIPDSEICYAYLNHGTNKWGDKHIHFYKDGPM